MENQVVWTLHKESDLRFMGVYSSIGAIVEWACNLTASNKQVQVTKIDPQKYKFVFGDPDNQSVLLAYYTILK